MAEVRSDDGWPAELEEMLVENEARRARIARFREGQRQYLLDLGVPTSWLAHCQFMEMVDGVSDADPPASGRRVVFTAGGDSPWRSLRQFTRAVDFGFELSISPPSDFDLNSLRPLLPRLKGLMVGGLHRITGWSALSESALIYLWAGHPSEPLPAIPSLERFSGDGAGCLGVLSSEGLTEASVYLSGDPWKFSGTITSPLESLHLNRPRGMTALPSLAHPEALHTLVVHSLTSLDVASLAGCTNLRSLTLSRVREIHNLSAIRHLEQLEEIVITGARSIDDWEVLMELDVERVVIERSPAIPIESQELLMSRAGSASPRAD